MKTVRMIFKGRVQGVGFRWTVLDLAENLKLNGSVQNLKDGSVEVILQGPPERVDHFIKAIVQDPGQAHITSTNSEELLDAHPFQHFRILH